MKKYYINIRNSKKGKMFDLLELARVVLAILLLLVLLLIGPWYLGIFCAFLAGMLSWLMVPSTVYALSNCIYVDDEKGEILLKRFRRKDQVIKLSSITRVETAKNDDESLGGISGRRGAIVYAVKNSDGYIMFYFVNDKVLLNLFESYNIPIIKIDYQYI